MLVVQTMVRDKVIWTYLSHLSGTYAQRRENIAGEPEAERRRYLLFRLKSS